jgi:diacylglycerol kinase family enzyme
MRPVLILNDGAGSLNGDRRAESPDAVRAVFVDAGADPEVRLTSPDRLIATLERARQDRPPAVFVGGGDGTISTAAGCLAGTGIPLGVVPLGTLNHFARDLGLPVDWREAAPALVRGQPRPVDVGEVNGRVFINNCSLGSYPEAVRQREAIRRVRGAGKGLAMLIASVAVFRRLRRLRLRIDKPDTTLALRTPFLLVGNNAYSGHVLDSNLRPRLDEGRLWLYTTRAHRRLALLRLAWQSLVRTIDDADGLETHPVSEVTIHSESQRLIPLAVDGELVPPVHTLRLRARPGALRVIAPDRAAPP